MARELFQRPARFFVAGISQTDRQIPQKTDNAAAVALKVARAIRASCSDDEIDVNIVTGPCMVANAKTGRRRNVVVV
ncbi:MAG: hypothetical protein ACPG4D_05220, partial [Alphaproteobacteria bacterium]